MDKAYSNIMRGCKIVELVNVENDTAIYKDNGKTITVIRETINDKIDFQMLIDSLISILEREEND